MGDILLHVIITFPIFSPLFIIKRNRQSNSIVGKVSPYIQVDLNLSQKPFGIGPLQSRIGLADINECLWYGFELTVAFNKMAALFLV